MSATKKIDRLWWQREEKDKTLTRNTSKHQEQREPRKKKEEGGHQGQARFSQRSPSRLSPSKTSTYRSKKKRRRRRRRHGKRQERTRSNTEPKKNAHKTSTPVLLAASYRSHKLGKPNRSGEVFWCRLIGGRGLEHAFDTRR